jgi:hypothetical protein
MKDSENNPKDRIRHESGAAILLRLQCALMGIDKSVCGGRFRFCPMFRKERHRHGRTDGRGTLPPKPEPVLFRVVRLI